MTKRYSSEVERWVEENQGKHFCQCGCGKVFKISPHHFYQGIPDYTVGHSPKSVLARNKYRGTVTTKGQYRNTERDFWNLVDKQPNGCWLWLGGKDAHGYGKFYYKGRRSPSSRLSYFFTNKRWPMKGLVCHTCDTPSCVNPQHLFDGSQEDNMNDAAVKGRINHKFAKDQILEVFEFCQQGGSRTEAALQWGMSKPLVDKIMQGVVWSHLTGIPKKPRIKYKKSI